MQENNEGKCKWCGLPMHVENPFNDYCSTTCQIAALEEDPANIRRRRTMQIFIVTGVIYSVILASIDTNFLVHLPFYLSAGALIGWLVGIPMSWFLYFANKRSKVIFNTGKLFAK
jgi:hypothetical protein